MRRTIMSVFVILFCSLSVMAQKLVEEWKFNIDMPKTVIFHTINNTKASLSIVADANQPLGKGILQAVITKASGRKSAYDIQILCVTKKEFSGGENVRVSFYVKGSEATKAQVSMIISDAPYSAVAKPSLMEFPVSSEWKKVLFETTMQPTMGKRYCAPMIFLGRSSGTIQFADIKFETVLNASTNPSLISYNAQKSFREINLFFAQDCVQINHRNKGSFKGPLPATCRDNFSYWNNSVVESSEHKDGNCKFLRIDVKKLDKAAQFKIESADIPTGYYKLAIKARIPAGFDIGIRQTEPPYPYLWRQNLEPSSKWRTISTILHINKTMKTAAGIYLKFPLGGTELESLRLLEATREDIESLIADDQAMLLRPSKDSQNFIRNSRFPLGLPSGWSVDRASYPGNFSVKTDTSELGPSGCHPLIIDGTIVRSEPFNTPFYNTGRNCVLSFLYKAKKSFHVSIYAANINQKTIKERFLVKRKNIPASDKWIREDIEFKEPDDKTKCLSISFEDGKKSRERNKEIFSDHAEIKLDSLQVYYGKAGRPYQSGSDCEVAIAPVESEVSAERVQFSDEPAKVKYFASGNIKNTVLKVTVYDIYGRKKELPEISLTKNPSGEFDYNVIPLSRLGQFRIEVLAERNGKQVSPVNELVMTRIRRPLYWGKDAPGSPFGIHVALLKLRSMKAAGMNWVRLHDVGEQYIKWFYLEPEKGKWNFHDKEINLYRRAHMKIAGMLDTTPEWAACTPDKKSPYWDRYRRPKKLDDYANYVRTVVSRYKDIIDEYIIWNEPTWNGSGYDSRYWWKTYDNSVSISNRKSDSIGQFIELSKVAGKSAKEVFPNVRIIGMHCRKQPWMNELRKGGVFNYYDMVDIHYYPHLLTEMTTYGYPGDKYEKESVEALRIAKEEGKPLINTECNPCSIDRNVSLDDAKAIINDGAGIYRHSIAWKSPSPVLDIANATVTFTMKNLAIGVSRLFLYSASSYQFLPCATPYYLIMLGADGYPTPTYSAFSNLAWLLEDRKFVKCIPVGEGVWAHIFEGRGACVAAISGKKNSKYVVPDLKDTEILDLFGNFLPKGAEYKGHIIYLQSKLPAKAFVDLLKRK